MARTLTLEKTYAQMQALIASNGLDTQTFYKITDRGDNGLLFRAAATNRLENDGIRYMLCPATYATGADAYSNDWIGVWNATKQATATEGQLAIWNGLVWIAGAVLSGDSPDTEASGWTVIPKASFTNHEYVEMIFGVNYDFENDWINKQWDSKGNIFGLDKLFYLYWEEPDIIINFIDYCDWNFSSNGKGFINNTCWYIYNNSNDGDIICNSNQGFIYNNSNKGSIYNNSNANNIENNSNNGDIGYNSNIGNIYDNSNNGIISYNSNLDNIGTNSNNGNIYKNTNGHYISDNSSVSNNVCNITFNGTGVGIITGIWDADVTDGVVDKIGTA